MMRTGGAEGAKARILESVAISFSRGSSQLRNRTPVFYVSYICKGSPPLVPTQVSHNYTYPLPPEPPFPPLILPL